MSENAWKYRLEFEKGAPFLSHLSPDIRLQNPGWGDDIYKSSITQMEFFLPTGNKIIMRGMIEYNFFIEAIQSMSRNNGADLHAVYICGRFPESNIVDLWKIGNGAVVHDRKIYGQEYDGTATRGWKPGIPLREVISQII